LLRVSANGTALSRNLQIYISGSAYAVFACGTIDPLIGGLSYHATSQLQVLKDNLHYLDLYVDEELSSLCDNNEAVKLSIIYNKIRQCIQRYQDIIE
jgi:hypothetical protein